MATTYEPLASTTLGSAAASVTFSSISGSYTDLVVIINSKITVGDQGIRFRFNSDSGSNYSFTYLGGNGTTASSGRQSNKTGVDLGNADATNFNPTIVHIQNYANTTTYKTAIGRTNVPALYLYAYVGLWRSTSAITSIVIDGNSGINFASGSTFTLYGILAA